MVQSLPHAGLGEQLPNWLPRAELLAILAELGEVSPCCCRSAGDRPQAWTSQAMRDSANLLSYL